jgi:hypothetical protein
MTIDELLSLAGLTANDEIPVWDAEAADEPTKKITAQNLAASVKALAGLVGEAEFTEQLADKADVIVDTASGAIASFPDGAAVAAKDITIGIEPVQDLHGYDNPWPAGGGKNLLPLIDKTIEINGVTVVVSPNGILFNGTSSASAEFEITTFSGDGSFIANDLAKSQLVDIYMIASSGTVGFRSTDASFTNDGTARSIKAYFATNKTFNNVLLKPMIRLASVSGATFAPYSNICPISGWTGANVVVSPTTDAQDGTTYPISWQSVAGTVYGGTLDVTTGLLTVDRAKKSYTNNEITFDTTYGTGVKFLKPTNSTNYGNYGETQNPNDKYYVIASKDTVHGNYSTASYNIPPSELPSDVTDTDSARAAYTGMEICYYLKNPIIYQLTPTEVDTVLGDNNVWADTGDSTVTYRADTKLYIQKINAPTDDDMIADAQIASGRYFIVGGNLYRSTTTIPAGDTITPGTNCILTNLADALNALNT